MALRGSETYVTCGLFRGEAGACLGIDVQTTRGAPAGEVLRIDYGPDDLDAFGGEFLFALGGALLLSCVGAGQPVGIRHDAQDRRIVGFVEPGHADGLHLAGGDEAVEVAFHGVRPFGGGC